MTRYSPYLQNAVHFSGCGTLHDTQVAGRHRSSPSAALDKLFRFVLNFSTILTEVNPSFLIGIIKQALRPVFIVIIF